METTHPYEQAQPMANERQRPREDWFDEGFVAYWIDQQESRADERRRQFVRVRSVLPKESDEEFRYLNLGAGPGNLDEVLLLHFPRARATLLDGSPAMLAEARKRLERFEGRVEFVQVSLATPEWTGAVKGPFDVAVSVIALHNLRDAARLRQLYKETYGLLGQGGLFVNLDYVRIARPSLVGLALWASRDPEAGFNGARGGSGMPGTVEEQLGWLREAGFGTAECLWREFQVALMAGVCNDIHLPGGDEMPAAGAQKP